jgi:hypothetical protein
MKKLAVLFLCTALSILATSCMTLRNLDTDNKPVSSVKIDFSEKKIAILPVYADEALLTDSQLGLKRYINKELDSKVASLIDEATVIPSSETIQILTDNNKLDILDNLATTYNKVGVFSRQDTQSILNELKADFIVVSSLNAEKLNLIVLKATGAPLM